MARAGGHLALTYRVSLCVICCWYKFDGHHDSDHAAILLTLDSFVLLPAIAMSIEPHPANRSYSFSRHGHSVL